MSAVMVHVMIETGTLQRSAAIRKKSWPTPQDYNEAIQNPTTCFADPELRASSAITNDHGLPKPVSGAFASVYQMKGSERTLAVRCFLHNVGDQERRYELISHYITGDDLPYTVTCEYQKEGIRINGEWFPLLKMEWVNGETLERYIERNLTNRRELELLRDRFNEMCSALVSAGIAHGDLQHGNIMVTPGGELRLVDYDGLYLPSMNGWLSNELGHRNYQHPQRDAEQFGASLDNFSMWVISLSLAAICHSPDIYRQLGRGNDCLIFRKIDFEDVWNSDAFAKLDALSSEEIKRQSRCLKWLATSLPTAHIPLGHSTQPLPLPANRARQSSTSTREAETWWNDFPSDTVQEPAPNRDYPLGSGAKRTAVHRIEPELQSDGPRRLIKSNASYTYPDYPWNATVIFVGLAFLGVFCLAVPFTSADLLNILVIACSIYFGMWLFCRERHLVMYGVPSPGRVIAKTQRETVDSEGDKKTIYTIKYGFQTETASGNLETTYSEMNCNAQLYGCFAEKELITVLYARNNVQRNIIYRISRYRAAL